jgi:tRNA A-37 threonylcarbamoyl transferase component Bud32
MNIEDPQSLIGYLRERGFIAADEIPEVRPLGGGVSNRVVLVRPVSRQPFVMKQALEKLRVDVDWYCTPDRINNEASALRSLQEVAPAGSIPELRFCDTDEHLLAMEYIDEPHTNWKQMLLAGHIERHHVARFARLLACIHAGSAERQAHFARSFADLSVFETLRLEPYYRYTAAQVPETAPFLADLISDTLQHRMALVHGDFSPKNILIRSDRMVLLDCEVAHFGDPGFDIGFSIAHFLGKANHLLAKRSQVKEAALLYWQTYADSFAGTSWVEELEARAVRHALGCTLARVSGRSPLEYLTADERAAQKKAVLEVLRRGPTDMPAAIREFVGLLPCQTSNV